MRGNNVMEPPAAHVEVAAFVLGILDEEENEIFEAHLAECAECQAELRELYVMPPVLDEVARIEPTITAPEPSPRVLTALLDDVTRLRRRRRYLMSAGAVAAAAVVAVTPLATRSLWTNSSSPTGRTGATAAAAPHTGTEILQATNRSNAVNAKITIQPRSWGTQVDIELAGVRGPLHCQLVVVTHSGKSEVVLSWQVPASQGYGVPGFPTPLRAEGGTAYFRGDIDRFEFRTTSGPNILNVPA
ncbi:MAG TPA: zf-HC2 domain-containing protein [Streptosporangiaceae bacterium]